MKKYSCVIVDDEPLAADVIMHYLAKLDEFEVVSVFTNPVEAFSFLRSQETDLLFLDIEMPEFSGIELLKSLKKLPDVILTTAYREYAVEGFDLNVLDYLVKPIPMDRFMRAIDKFLDGKVSIPLLSGSITVRSDRKYVQVELNEILFIEGLKDYIKIKLKDGQLLTKMTLGKIADELSDKGFVRIHRSFVVSKSAINAYSGQSVEVGGEELPVGRSYRDDFLSRMG